MSETSTEARPDAIPLTLVTGFLGAGKTTLLNRILKDPEFAETVVIVNEFGEIGLDHLLIESVEDGLILMESGCLCCTIRGDLIVTLEDLLRRRDNNRMPPFRRLVIETTGLADPAPILNVLINHPYLAMRYQIDGVLTLVDAVNAPATLEAHPEAGRQVVAADRIMLTKTALAEAAAGAGPASVAKLRQHLQQLNPGVDMIAEDASAASIIGAGFYTLDARPAAVRDWLAADAADTESSGHAHHHVHDDGHIHGLDEIDHWHDVNRHSQDIRAFTLVADAPVSITTFELFWTLLRSTHGPKLLRLKGIVNVAEHPEQPLVIHAVQHVLHPPIVLERWPDSDHRSRLVLIAKGLEEPFVQRLWAAFLGKS